MIYACCAIFCAISMFGLFMESRDGRVYVDKRLEDEKEFIESGKSLYKAHVRRGILDDIKVVFGGSKRLAFFWTLMQVDTFLHLDWDGTRESSCGLGMHFDCGQGSKTDGAKVGWTSL
ncbi:hypothetical protein PG991_008867 [Apiospora marii]|uniref:Uncharacterized protein n=1 Tax=Apiospora marii TaxID=335849 RepID=A0ABR1RN72_9PEZI